MTLITAKLSRSAFFGLTLVLLVESTMYAADSKVALDAEQERIVRKAVYEGISGINRNFDAHIPIDTLTVPKPLVELYRTQPRPVIELMLRIIDGAEPEVSARAAGYALELLVQPGVGVIVVMRYFDSQTTYDSIKEGGKITDRQHWMRLVNQRLKEKLPEK